MPVPAEAIPAIVRLAAKAAVPATAVVTIQRIAVPSLRRWR